MRGTLTVTEDQNTGFILKQASDRILTQAPHGPNLSHGVVAFGEHCWRIGRPIVLTFPHPLRFLFETGPKPWQDWSFGSNTKFMCSFVALLCDSPNVQRVCHVLSGGTSRRARTLKLNAAGNLLIQRNVRMCG
jgi:hypothetical protein